MATRKILSLIDEKPEITVIAPEVTPEIMSLSADHRIRWICRAFEPEDINSTWRMIFSCTNCHIVNKLIGDAADMHGIWVNIADNPQASSMHMAAVGRFNGITLAVNTAQADPKKAQSIRDLLIEKLRSS